MSVWSATSIMGAADGPEDRAVLRYDYDPSYFPGRGYNYYAGPGYYNRGYGYINRRVGTICSSCVAGCLTIAMELDSSWTCREEG
jgi:hypothetical protein